MIAGMFEVVGVISVERFQSLTDRKKILSLPFFEDANAVVCGRTLGTHRTVQAPKVSKSTHSTSIMKDDNP